MRKELLDLGFEELPHPAIGQPLIFKIKRRFGKTRILSVGSLQTPNEIVSIGELKLSNDKEYEDLTIISNYDYDGYISLDRIKALLFGLTGEERFS